MRKLLLLAGVAAGFAVSGAAQAASTFPVAVGDQSRPPASAPKGATLNEFFPDKLVISAGDSVTFTSNNFHTVTYVTGKPAGLFVPDPSKATFSGVTDAAGQPFYFNGLPKLIYNLAAFGPAPAKAIDGSATVSSGVIVPSGPKAKPVTVTYAFPKAGTYRLICQIHVGMKIDVTVKPAGAAVPRTPAQVQGDILSGQAAAWGRVTKLAAATKTPPATVYMGVGANETVLGYFPKTLSVKAGTTVTFVVKSSSEVHNVAFGPLKWLDAFEKKNDLLPFGPPGSPNQVSPLLVFGSDPAGKVPFDGANHGNGVYATGVNAGSPLIPLPHSSKVTFTKPGTYKYICLIHGPDMSGTIVVTS